MDGAKARLDREYNDRMIQAYYTAFLPGQKKPTKLKDLLIRGKKEVRETSWTDEFAAFAAWAEAKS